MAHLSRHEAKNSTGGILALAPSLLLPSLPAAPHQQELARATVTLPLALCQNPAGSGGTNTREAEEQAAIAGPQAG